MKTCIHTVILNELDEYLKVWLDHHTKMVDHIFIFEDIGSHSHKHITDQYPNVTLWSVLDIYDTEDGKQRLIKNKERGGINQRFYILDGITLQEPYKAIPEVLSEFQDNVAVMLQWQNYGANGHIYKPNYDGRDYREFYTKKVPFNKSDAELKITSKICWNLNKSTRWHYCGLHCTVGNWVNTKGNKDRKEICYDKMYLAHYVTRSWEEWVWKLYQRGMHCGNRHRKDEQFFEMNTDMLPMYNELIEIKNKILNV